MFPDYLGTEAGTRFAHLGGNKASLPGLNFINVLRTAFTLVDPESAKNTVKSLVSFYAFGIYERKSFR